MALDLLASRGVFGILLFKSKVSESSFSEAKVSNPVLQKFCRRKDSNLVFQGQRFELLSRTEDSNRLDKG